ncbi:hypothetical protein D3C83_73800 [compost metagenome]
MAHAGVAHRRDVAQHVAFRRLDLDHVRAEVREQLRRERPQHHGGEVEDADAGQRPAHAGLAGE